MNKATYHLGQLKSNTLSKIHLFLLKSVFTAAHWLLVLMISVGPSYLSYKLFYGVALDLRAFLIKSEQFTHKQKSEKARLRKKDAKLLIVVF